MTLSDSEPEPDVAVVRGTLSEFATHHPETADLVIEVCITSQEYDRSKLRAYAVAGVKECWLVLAPEKRVEIFRHPQGGAYSSHSILGTDETVKAEALPQVSLPVAEIVTAQ